MSRVTLQQLKEEIDGLNSQLATVTQKYEASKSELDRSRKARTDADVEVLRLRLLASEMRGFIMAHHSTEDPNGGETLYRTPYSGTDDNEVAIAAIKYPFMDSEIVP